jgi:hypothetical protein
LTADVSALALETTAQNILTDTDALDTLLKAGGAGDAAAIKTAAERLTAVRAAILTDWIDGGRLDTILDAINTAAARLTAERAQVLTDWINDGRLDLILDAAAASAQGSVEVDIEGDNITIE